MTHTSRLQTVLTTNLGIMGNAEAMLEWREAASDACPD
jgi:hypothetical protein